MNEFLRVLEKALLGMDAKQKAEILSDYQEHFSLGIATGKTEEEIARSLGDPVQLANMYTTAHRARQGGFADALRMLGAALSFRVGGGLLMGTIYFACFGCIALLYVTAASLIVASVGCIVFTGMELARGYGAFTALSAFAALLFASCGLLWISGDTKMWKACATRLPLLARRIMKLRGAKEAL
jgi:uncharacterized membrane protein